MQDDAGGILMMLAKELRMTDTRNGITRQENCKYVVSYGGGVNSTAMIIFLVKNKFPLDYVVFSDTGDEMPETYEYLDVIRKYLAKHKIPFEIVHTRNGESLSDRCIRKRVIPSMVWRWCTRDLKVTPIHAFYRTLKCHIYQYMGIDYDEFHRMKDARVDYVSNLFPLVDFKIGREECRKIIKKARLPMPVKSGCYFCPYNNTDRWREIYDNHPDLFKFAIKIEENGKHMPRQTLSKIPLRQLGQKFKKNEHVEKLHIDSPCGGECMS